MTEQQALQGYDQVVRKQQFELAHPGVSIDHKAAPYWHWTATWTNKAGEVRTTTDRELRKVLNALDKIDWTAEQPKVTPGAR